MNIVEIVNLIKEVGVSIVIIAAVVYLLIKYFSNLIDNKNSKTNIFKDTFYLIIDTSIQLFNIISDLLLN